MIELRINHVSAEKGLSGTAVFAGGEFVCLGTGRKVQWMRNRQSNSSSRTAVFLDARIGSRAVSRRCSNARIATSMADYEMYNEKQREKVEMVHR